MKNKLTLTCMPAIAALFLAGSLFGANQAAAQVGGYCSAKTYDGRWAFFFSDYFSADAACATVRSSLGGSVENIEAWRSGTYFVDGVNRVLVRCFTNSNRVTSFGSTALESAYEWAAGANNTSCLFSVNHY